MANTPISQLEWEWFAARASVASTVPVGTLKLTYFARGSLASVALKPLSQLETEWLALITGLSVTAGQQALWQSAVAQYTSSTSSRYINDNKFLFFSQATAL